MRIIICLVFVLLFPVVATAAVAGNCSDADKYDARWNIDGEALFSFTSRVIDAVKDHDMRRFVEFIDGELSDGPSREYLLSHKFSEVFPDEFVSRVVDGGPTCSWFNDQGTFIGSGLIWIKSRSPEEFHISALNGYIPEKRVPGLPAGWAVDGRFLPPGCFVREWESSDNFEEFAKLLNVPLSLFLSDIGRYQAEIPSALKPSWCAAGTDCEAVFSRMKISDCCDGSTPLSRHETVEQGGDPDRELVFSGQEPSGSCRIRILGEVPAKLCQDLAPGYEAHCSKAYLISLLENDGGSMSFLTVGVYGLFSAENSERFLVPLKFFKSEAEGLNHLDSIRGDD